MGKKTVVVPFSECAIIERLEAMSIILPHLHKGEVLVAPEYQVPGGTPLERVTDHASPLGYAAITKARELSGQVANKTAEYGQKTVNWAAELAHKGANKSTDLVSKNDDR